jgi:hypothetical protein
MKLLSEVLKVDQAIVPQAVAPAAIAVSGLFPLDMHRKALAVFNMVSTTMDGGDVLQIGIVDDTQVTPAASAALAALNVLGLTLAYELVTASTRVTALSIETAASGDGAIVVNGTTFTWLAVPVLATDWNTAAQLAAAITGAGLGLTAVDVGTVVTIRSTIPGAVAITVTETVTAIIAADVLTLEAVAYLEVDASQCAAGATGIYIVFDNPVANTGTVTVAVDLLRGDPRYAPPAQAVAANS